MPALLCLPDVPAYLRFVDDLIEQGFRAIKFHTWCLPDRDLELARAVRKSHPGQEVAFMLDVENNYDRRSALRAAQELEDLGFGWFEAPFPDFDLEGYSELTRRVDNSHLAVGKLDSGFAGFFVGVEPARVDQRSNGRDDAWGNHWYPKGSGFGRSGRNEM